MLEVKRIVNEVFASNTYLLLNDKYPYCWLIDIGDYSKVVDSLPKGVAIKGLFLTHTHFDHIYGINDLHDAHPECSIYTSAYGREALYDERKNLSRYHESPITFEGDKVNVLEDGDSVELFQDSFLLAYYTPGHCLSSLTYEVGNYLFTGDAYIPGIKVVTNLPGGNLEQALVSDEKIKQMANDKVVLAGHGSVCI